MKQQQKKKNYDGMKYVLIDFREMDDSKRKRLCCCLIWVFLLLKGEFKQNQNTKTEQGEKREVAFHA